MDINAQRHVLYHHMNPAMRETYRKHLHLMLIMHTKLHRNDHQTFWNSSHHKLTQTDKPTTWRLLYTRLKLRFCRRGKIYKHRYLNRKVHQRVSMSGGDKATGQMTKVIISTINTVSDLEATGATKSSDLLRRQYQSCVVQTLFVENHILFHLAGNFICLSICSWQKFHSHKSAELCLY